MGQIKEKRRIQVPQALGQVRRDSAPVYPLDLEKSIETSFVVDAEAFGSPAHFTMFALALDAAAAWPKRRVRLAVCSVDWAADGDVQRWASMKWGLILVMPRPASLFDLSAVRRLARQGPLEIFPSYDSDLPRQI
jgi:hypothetical protein